MFPKVELLEETKGEVKEEKNDKKCMVIKYITFV
jgi:hypothetical protein